MKNTGKCCFVVVTCIALALLLSSSITYGQDGENETGRVGGSRPWFDRQKIRFFWGPNYISERDGLAPEEWVRRIAQIGATVIVDHHDLSPEPYIKGKESRLPAFRPIVAKAARENGLRCFGMRNLADARFVAKRIKGHLAVSKHGQTSFEARAKGVPISSQFYIPCPLDEQVIEQWFYVPAIDAAKSGVVDGFHTDWESYGALGYDQLGDYLCYCDNCWSEHQGKRPPQQNLWAISKAFLNLNFTMAFIPKRPNLLVAAAAPDPSSPQTRLLPARVPPVRRPLPTYDPQPRPASPRTRCDGPARRCR